MAVVELPIDFIRSFSKPKEFIEVMTKIGFPTEGNEEKIYVETTPNRPDILGWYGIKRAYLAYTKKQNKMYVAEQSEYKIVNNMPKKRPYIVGAVIKSANIELENIIQIQEKLHKTLGRNRKKVAIGIHNLDKVRFPLVYKEGVEKFIPLYEKEKMNYEEIIEKTEKGKEFKDISGKFALYDQKGVISMPPIINSERTKIDERTKNFFIDVTGTNKEAISLALNILVCEFIDAGGVAYKVEINGEGWPKLEYKTIEFDDKKIEKIGGIKITEEEQKTALEKMGWFRGKRMLIPPYRGDVFSDADVIEDILIGYGYENILSKQPKIYTEGNIDNFRNNIREFFIGLGFQEIYNFFLTNQEALEKIKEQTELKIINPVSKEYSVIKPTSLVSIIEFLKKNKMKPLPMKVFGIDKIYKNNKEKEVLFFAIADNTIHIGEGISIIEEFKKYFNIDLDLEIKENKKYIKGRFVEIKQSKKIGEGGEIDINILLKNNLEFPVLFFEIETEKIKNYLNNSKGEAK